MSALARRSSRSTPPSALVRELDDLEARHRDGRGVGAVGGVGREHLVAGLAAVLVVGAGRAARPASSPWEPAEGCSETWGRPGDLGERLLEVPHQLQRPLRALGVLERVQPRVAGQRRDALVQPGVVLHRARAQRIEAGVEVEVALGEARRSGARSRARRSRAARRARRGARRLRQQLLEVDARARPGRGTGTPAARGRPSRRSSARARSTADAGSAVSRHRRSSGSLERRPERADVVLIRPPPPCARRRPPRPGPQPVGRCRRGSAAR